MSEMRSKIDAVQSALDELKAQYERENPQAPPAPDVIRVKPGEDADAAFLQALADNKNLLLYPGEHFVNWRVLNQPRAKSILVTTDTAHVAARMTSEYKPDLAILRAKDPKVAALTYDPQSTGVNLFNIGVGPQDYSSTQIVMGHDKMMSPDMQPHDIIFDRVLMFGDDERGQHRGITCAARNFSVLNSAFYQFHEQGRDSQCIASWNGGQGLIIRGTFLQGGAENIMFGGGAVRDVSMIPSDILIDDCYFTKDIRWKAGMVYKPQIKCLLEVKTAKRLTLSNSVLEHCWPAAWPQGVALAIKCNDGSEGKEPWTTTEDVTVINNVIRRVGKFMSIVAMNDGGYTTEQMKRLKVINNLCYEMATSEWPGEGRAFTAANLPAGLEVRHNSIFGGRNAFFYYWYDQKITRGSDIVLADNASDHGTYGIRGADGTSKKSGEAALLADTTSYQIAGNALSAPPAGASANKLPIGNMIVPKDAFTASLDVDFTVRPSSVLHSLLTTDGKVVGADIEALAPVIRKLTA